MGKSLKNIVKVVFPTQYWGTKATVSTTQKAAAALGMSKKTSSPTDGLVANTASDLAKERDENVRKRVRLYATQNGELGEEVNSVGISGNRGKIFS